MRWRELFSHDHLTVKLGCPQSEYSAPRCMEHGHIVKDDLTQRDLQAIKDHTGAICNPAMMKYRPYGKACRPLCVLNLCGIIRFHIRESYGLPCPTEQRDLIIKVGNFSKLGQSHATSFAIFHIGLPRYSRVRNRSTKLDCSRTNFTPCD